MAQITHITNLDPDFTPLVYTVGTSSSQSAVIVTGSGLIRIATKACEAHIKFGANPTATTSDVLMPPDHVEIFSFKSGDKIAFIRSASSSGDISICAVD
jgi:hypothetical protein